MLAIHILGWVFVAPLAALFTGCTIYQLIELSSGRAKTSDVPALFIVWAAAFVFAALFCFMEGWL